MQLGEGELRGPIDGDKEVEPALGGAYALDHQPIGAPHGAILIGAWSNANDISLPRGRGSRGGRVEGATRANTEDSRLRRQRRRQYQHQQGDRGKTHGWA
ncbi:hypothetical protein [Reyranella soli]|uniref:Uncharacterized protein n=1 Tax=Reyranella soli TaxID=1230389 RepID=A0A512NIZ3_9HYPH|nr:hypothetical protein [Reyranella soli]GEP58919.1 hypothetical protein RSO01_60850 [Reyranella soli]